MPHDEREVSEMKRVLHSLPAVSMIVFLASCAGPRPAKPKAAETPVAAATIEGSWQEIRNENQAVTGKTWTFAGNRVIIHDLETTYTGTFTCGDSREPKEIDLTFEGYPVNQGIYLLTGGILTLKVRESAAERAKGFGIEKGYTLILCDRAKEKPAK
jgi:uncharacterized protein (TIGR03067 family)